ncbi:hypothetical protein ACLKA7_014956 [Drosophila subpalustris]
MITATIDTAQVVESRRSQNEDAPRLASAGNGAMEQWSSGVLEWVATGQWFAEWSYHCTTCYRRECRQTGGSSDQEQEQEMEKGLLLRILSNRRHKYSDSRGVASGSRTHVELDAPSHGLSTSTSTSKSMFMTMSMSMEEGGTGGCLTKRAQ